MDEILEYDGSATNKFRLCDWQMNGARSAAKLINVFIGISHEVL
jgi:hypothetical protein